MADDNGSQLAFARTSDHGTTSHGVGAMPVRHVARQRLVRAGAFRGGEPTDALFVQRQGLPAPRLSARHRLGEATFAGMGGKEEVALIPAVRGKAIETDGITPRQGHVRPGTIVARV